MGEKDKQATGRKCPAKEFYLIFYILQQYLKQNFNVNQHYSILIVLYTNFAY